MKTQIESRCYTVQEIAKILNISTDAVYELIRRKLVPTLDVGTSKKLIPVKEFEEWYAGRIMPAKEAI